MLEQTERSDYDEYLARAARAGGSEARGKQPSSSDAAQPDNGRAQRQDVLGALHIGFGLNPGTLQEYRPKHHSSQDRARVVRQPERDGAGARERAQQDQVAGRMKVSIFIFLALALSSCGKAEIDKCIEATFEAKMNEAVRYGYCSRLSFSARMN